MLAYYANSQGWGHLQFARQFAREADVLILSSHPEVATTGRHTVTLPDDLPDETTWPLDAFPPPGYLHYAPVGMQKIQLRYRQMLEAFERHAVSFLIADVSVEVAAFARICGIPYAYVRLMGERDDPPHRMAYEGAIFLLAYFPAALEPAETPAWIREKTIYLGFFSRFSPMPQAPAADNRFIVIISGGGRDAGGMPINYANIGECFPNHQIEIFGHYPPASCPSNAQYFGKVADLSRHLQRAHAVIATAGANVVSEIATYGLRYLAVPEARPYREQQCMAEALAAHGFCRIVTTHEPNLAELVEDLRPAWSGYVQPDAVSRFVKWFSQRKNRLPEMAADVTRFSQGISGLVNHGA